MPTALDSLSGGRRFPLPPGLNRGNMIVLSLCGRECVACHAEMHIHDAPQTHTHTHKHICQVSRRVTENFCQVLPHSMTTTMRDDSEIEEKAASRPTEQPHAGGHAPHAIRQPGLRGALPAITACSLRAGEDRGRKIFVSGPIRGVLAHCSSGIPVHLLRDLVDQLRDGLVLIDLGCTTLLSAERSQGANHTQAVSASKPALPLSREVDLKGICGGVPHGLSKCACWYFWVYAMIWVLRNKLSTVLVPGNWGAFSVGESGTVVPLVESAASASQSTQPTRAGTWIAARR